MTVFDTNLSKDQKTSIACSLRTYFLAGIYGDADTADKQLGFIKEVCHSFEGRALRFMDDTEYQHIAMGNTRRAMEIYWSEILRRAYWCAAVALLRTNSWLSGVLVACDARNYHLIATSMRGLLESTSDINSAFRGVATTLADHYVQVRIALRGKMAVATVCQELEDALIHFTHARQLRKGEDAPASHRARKAKEYLDELGSEFAPKAKETYDVLCTVSHPSAYSLHCFASTDVEADRDLVRLAPADEPIHAASMLVAHADTMRDTVQMAVNHALILLRLLNIFPLTEIKTPGLDRLGLSSIELWRKVSTTLRRHGVEASKLA